MCARVMRGHSCAAQIFLPFFIQTNILAFTFSWNVTGFPPFYFPLRETERSSSSTLRGIVAKQYSRTCPDEHLTIECISPHRSILLPPVTGLLGPNSFLHIERGLIEVRSCLCLTRTTFTSCKIDCELSHIFFNISGLEILEMSNWAVKPHQKTGDCEDMPLHPSCNFRCRRGYFFSHAICKGKRVCP